jgi:anti-anti-sigma regulatory factor
MPCNDASAIRVAHTTAGFLVRVEGWGTMRESPTLQGFASECLEREASLLVVDLSPCDHLDSTFLGCLVGLHRRFGGGDPPRFVVAASPPQRQRLLAPLQLHRVLTLIDEAPQAGQWLTLYPFDESSARNDLRQAGQHILECHRRLAELGGVNEAVFGPIVEQLASELGCWPGSAPQAAPSAPAQKSAERQTSTANVRHSTC